MHIYKFFIAALVILVACTNPEKNPVDNAGPATTTPNCYRYINNKDTVNLQIVPAGDSITGTLVFNFFEKDKNTGTIRGIIKDGMLLADYHFRSEGMLSTRQIAFKKVGENYAEGVGELDMSGETVRFLNIDSLDFTKGVFLRPVNCD